MQKGLLLSYMINETCNEHIIQFALEGWLISDIYSFITGEPSPYNIDVLEDPELVLISNAGMDELRKRIPKFLEFSFVQLRSACIAFEKRVSAMVNLTTQERYTQLMKTYPDMGQRIPQHLIASYLGLTPETLSRTGRQLTVRK